MPINQPPISPEDIVRSSWDLEATQLINRLEQLVIAQEQTITTLQGTLSTLRDSIQANTGDISTNTSSLSTLNAELDTVEADIVTLRQDIANAGVVRTVDQTGILNLSTEGALSTDPVVTSINGEVGAVTIGPGGTTVSLSQTDYYLMFSQATNSYTVTLSPEDDAEYGGNIPESHILFLGGLRLLQNTPSNTYDYSLSNNVIEFTSNAMAAALDGQIIQLTIFRI